MILEGFEIENEIDALINFKTYYKTQSPGVYALKLNSDGCLNGFNKDKLQDYCDNLTDNILYIGTTGCLTGRINNNHLGNNAAVSTLRRTIGWFMNMKIDSKKHFTKDEEKIITDWLLKNTHFEIIETTTKQEADELEESFIQKIKPPFNIDKRENAIKRSFK